MTVRHTIKSRATALRPAAPAARAARWRRQLRAGLAQGMGLLEAVAQLVVSAPWLVGKNSSKVASPVSKAKASLSTRRRPLSGYWSK